MSGPVPGVPVTRIRTRFARFCNGISHTYVLRLEIPVMERFGAGK